MTARPPDTGVILVNVLVALALGAALVTLMLTSQDVEIDRARRAAALAQAEAIAFGAEASVVVALRRDMRDGPDTDHLAEPWAAVAQSEVTLGPGRFSVTLHDAQARLNLNDLGDSGIVGQQVLLRLVTLLGLPAGTATTISQAIAQRGPVQGLTDIAGLSDQARDALAPHVSFLTVGAQVNLNTAGAEVLAAVVGSGSVAARLVQVRSRNGGFLTAGDLTDAGVIGTAGADFRSDTWDVVVVVEVDGVTLTLASRILRLREIGLADVYVIARRIGSQTAEGVLPTPDATLWLQ